MNEFWTGIYLLAALVFIVWVLRGSRRSGVEDRPSAGEGGSHVRGTGEDKTAPPTPQSRDDLTEIKGIGKVIESKLHVLGITSYDQIARFTAQDIERVDQVLDFKGRIQREHWIEQARELTQKKH